jgi:hypothetical protein
MSDLPETVRSLHAAYCRASRMEIRLTPDRERDWFDFLKDGFNLEDLVLVCGYLNREIANGNRNPGALKFSNLVRDRERFEEDLSLARKILRPRKPPTVQTTQNVGDVARTVEIPRPTEDDAIDVSKIFAAIRQNINTRG